MWYGESESNVRDIFAKAKQAAPCVLFFDEIDSMGGARGNSPGDSGVSDRVINTILTEMDGIGSKKNVFIIGATNRPDILDPALLRPSRLDQMLYVAPPDYDARLQIVKIAFKNTPTDDSVHFEEIAKMTEGFSGADITEICRNACRAALRKYIKEQQANATLEAENAPAVAPATGDDADSKAAKMEGVETHAAVARDDIVEALKAARKSIADADIQRYRAFAQKMASSGIQLPKAFNSEGDDQFKIDDDADLYD